MTRAADDFAAIRTHMEELRRAQMRPIAEPDLRRTLLVDRADTPPKIRRFLLKHGRERGLF